MSALDTSVIVPALLGWHEAHQQCQSYLQDAAAPAHAALEAYSVMTRLPPPHRLTHDAAAQLIERNFRGSRLLSAPASLQRKLVTALNQAAIAGGASYDGLVGLIASEHGHQLLTRDVRAARTYAALHIDFMFIEPEAS